VSETPAGKVAAPKHVKYLHKRIIDESKAQSVATKRIVRWVGYMVVAAMLDNVRDPDDHEPVFLIKGGVAMELHLNLEARATADLDTAFRASADRIETYLDQGLRAGFEGFTATRSKVEIVRDTGMRRFQIKLNYLGRPFSTVQLEVAETEVSMGAQIDQVAAKSLDVYGIDGPETVPCLPVRWIIAQKLHACTEVIDGRPNDRFRDLLDLPLLEELIDTGGWPGVRAACVELFDGRGKHPWPPIVTIFKDWPEGYAALAAETNVAITTVDDAAAAVSALIQRIDSA